MLTDRLLSFNFQRCVAGRPEFLARRSGRRFRFRSASIIYTLFIISVSWMRISCLLSLPLINLRHRNLVSACSPKPTFGIPATKRSATLNVREVWKIVTSLDLGLNVASLQGNDAKKNATEARQLCFQTLCHLGGEDNRW